MCYGAMTKPKISTQYLAKMIDARKSKGLSQAKLATKMGVGQSTIGSYETGATTPSFDTLVLWARVLDVSLDWLLDDARDEPLDLERAFRRLVVKLGGTEAAYDRLAMLDRSAPRLTK